MVTFADAKEVSAEIVKQLNPLLVTLFGSVARKASGNDLDILVVVEDREIGRASCRERVWRYV